MNKLAKMAGTSLLVLAASAVIGAETAQTEKEPQVAQVASLYKCVVKLHVKLGEQVKKGQLLFEGDQEILAVQKIYDEKNLEFQNLAVEKSKALTDQHLLPYDWYLQFLRDQGVAVEKLKKTNIQMQYSKYYAPFDGTVTKIVRYDGSGLGDNDSEVEVTEGKVDVDTSHQVAMVCNRWPGMIDVKVGLGDKVKKGQLLFTIDTADLEAQKRMDECTLNYDKLVVERYDKLLTTTVSIYKHHLAEMDYQNYIRNVKTDEIKIRQSSGYAPFDGTVTKVYRYTGSANGECKGVVDITAAM